MNRRAFLTSSSAALVAAAGCSSPESDPSPGSDESPESTTQLAHWVTVYLSDRDESRDVTVTVTNEGGDTLFEREFALSDDNEAHEDAPFSGSSEPETVTVTVDGERFERDWPGFERPELPCDGSNRAGIELWVENDAAGSPDVRMEADCQYVTMD